ncbi:fibronectin type III domain-containing protein [Streptomyces sp. NPDC059909]|uniref:fibronectin type III domain-containing protein n=1 Tax=Streptomyces sp. NPDC059909 TaxID=3346998 RepID=UPI0036544DF3
MNTLTRSRRTRRHRATGRAIGTALAGAVACLALPASGAEAATTCAAGVWKASYYANTTFAGTPKLTACDSAISESYGTGDPAGVTLPRDNFGVRWTTTRDFGSGGPFTFSVAVQDAVRVYLDGTRKIDLWSNVSSTRSKTVYVTVPKGTHTIRVDFAAFTGSANVKFSYAPRTSATVDKTAPLAPTGAKVAYDKATSKATFTWSRNKEMDLAGYKVYLRRPGTSTQVVRTTATSYTTTLPATGAVHRFGVDAVDIAGNTSSSGIDLPVTTVDRTAPQAPTGLTAADSQWDVTLGWKASEAGSAFKVYRADSATGPYSLAGTTKATTLALTDVPYSTARYYKVTATDAAGNTSAASTVLSYTRPTAVPGLYHAENNEADTGIRLLWEARLNAGTTGFRVYRSEPGSADPSWHAVTCEDFGEGGSTPYVQVHYCTDRTAVARTAYQYAVTSVDAQGRESERSAPYAITRVDRTPPPAVTGVTAKATPYGVVLDWDPSTAPDIAKFVIRREPVEKLPCWCNLAEVDAGTTHYVDRELPDGETLTYSVDAVDTSGNSLYTLYLNPEAMTFAEVTELDLTPSVDTPAGAPLDLTATAADSGQAVELGWDAVGEATGYRVHRWNGDAGTYEPLTAEPVTGLSYTDTTAATGTTHFYWVTAVLADGTESAPGDAWAILQPGS